MDYNNKFKKNEIIYQLALKILNDCKNNFIEIRILGSVALLFLDESKVYWLFETREQFGDIDFVISSKNINKFEEYFSLSNFRKNRSVTQLHGNQRRNYYSPENISVDIFINEIVLCQKIKVLNKFNLSYPTLTTTDLFLTKIQKVNLNKTDIFDINFIMNYEIDEEYIINLCVNDWKWWQTFQLNIPIIKNNIQNKNNINILNEILSSINKRKKTIKWFVRNIFGSKIEWYNYIE
jgi:hypothetical protein